MRIAVPIVIYLGFGMPCLKGRCLVFLQNFLTSKLRCSSSLPHKRSQNVTRAVLSGKRDRGHEVRNGLERWDWRDGTGKTDVGAKSYQSIDYSNSISEKQKKTLKLKSTSFTLKWTG